MNSKCKRYKETNPLQINIYLLFYLYVFAIFIIANVLPVLTVNYFLFLFLGIIGISILVIKFTYSISIKENTGMLSITIPLKISLLKLKVKEIETIEEITIDPLIYYGFGIKKLKPYYTAYLFNKGIGIKLTMYSGKIIIISCTDTNGIITRINALKEQGKK